MSTLQPYQSDRVALQRAGLALLHPMGSRGRVCTARAARDGHDWDEDLTPTSSRAISTLLASAEIEYVGMHRFSGRRHSACVTGISNGFLDLDHYREGLPHADASAEEVAAILIGACEAAGVPTPSFIQDSGRGAYAVWTFQGMSGQALDRWQTAMRNLRGPKLDAEGNVPKRRGAVEPAVEAFETRMLPLWRALRDLGLDRGAIDAARVLRLMGVINPKTGRMARLAWPSSIDDIKRLDFDAWCDAVMPYTRAEMRDLRAQREAWKAANPDYVKAERRPRRLSGSKQAMILGDMMRLLDHRGAGWFKENHRRDWWCLITATAIAQTTGGNAQEWADRLAHLVGLPVKEVAAALTGVERGMLAHAAGERREWKGEDRPAFYDFSYATIIDHMMITAEEAAEVGLRVLVPGGATPLTAAERQRASRAARAVVASPREVQAEERLHWGLDALEMRRGGATYADLVEAFGKGEDTIRRAIREVEAALAEGIPASVAAVSAVEEAGPTPDGMSRHIVVEDPIDPAAPASDPVPPRVTRWTKYHATIETASATWTWSRLQDRVLGSWDEMRLEAGSPTPEDTMAAEAASHELSQSLKRRRRPATRPTLRRPMRSRPVALQPLDPQREAELYREASGGGSFRHRLLVAA